MEMTIPLITKNSNNANKNLSIIDGDSLNSDLNNNIIEKDSILKTDPMPINGWQSIYPSNSNWISLKRHRTASYDYDNVNTKNKTIDNIELDMQEVKKSIKTIQEEFRSLRDKIESLEFGLVALTTLAQEIQEMLKKEFEK